MEGHLLVSKYQPTKISDFIGNTEQIGVIRDFLSIDWVGSRSLIIIGPSGCGKSTIMNLLIAECNSIKASLGIQVCRPNYENMLCHKDLQSQVENFVIVKTIFEMMTSQQKQKVLIMDDFDTLIAQDRYANNYIQEVHDKGCFGKKNFKMILIGSSVDERKFTDLKKKIKLVVRIHNPRQEIVVPYIERILNEENYDFTIEELRDIVVSLQCNIRNILTNITSFEERSAQHYMDKNIYDVVLKIMQRYGEDLNDLNVAMSSDPTIISYMLYDNYKAFCPGANHTAVTEKYVCSSIFEEYAYRTNDWTLIDISNLMRCGSVRHEMRKHRPIVPDNTPVQYTQITTRAAQHFNNMKIIHKYLEEHNINYRQFQERAESTHLLSTSTSTSTGKCTSSRRRAKADEKGAELKAVSVPHRDALSIYINNIIR